MEESAEKLPKPGRNDQPESITAAPTAGPIPDDDRAGRLDIGSERFDPLLALYSPTMDLPFPNIKRFNNVAEYQSFLKGGRGRAKPENVEKKLRKARAAAPDPERLERLRNLIIKPEAAEEPGSSGDKRRGRKQRAPKNVLTRMAALAGSPLGELNRCIQEKIRIKVHIRTFKGLRGVCSGFIMAFDKFWNLAMVDVDETYREPLLGEALYHEKALTITRLFEKLKVQESQETSRATGPDQQVGQHGPPYGRVHTRHLNQIFIRGENVLLVNIPPT
ncbi:U7 snRNA-associated Sm-like protein LSm11 isoform X2 [Denticeps clupeoides]|uniref:U7 snRNA-associated Sm-like protein LSm11 isoform X2 n=1 Tax=Denticeps clupeoides TaxID=299321 RepID=UPI0010A36D0B|nr:U7 snRNA-associated Sm-like protein LSm11 isoform X2 [Denticeps clupeoides]XP_028824168.1 U7 snRNA-associated Sm-like protein LSm11 isoform X2 [Denticeps clupeoides]